MKKHNWEDLVGTGRSVCFACGIIDVPAISYGNCPPWALTDEVDADTKRVHGAWEVKQLEYVQDKLDKIQECLINAKSNCAKNGIVFDLDDESEKEDFSFLKEELIASSVAVDACFEILEKIIQKRKSFSNGTTK